MVVLAEKFCFNLSSSSFVIGVNLLHPSLTIPIPLWSIIISVVFFYLSKLLFSGFCAWPN